MRAGSETGPSALLVREICELWRSLMGFDGQIRQCYGVARPELWGGLDFSFCSSKPIRYFAAGEPPDGCAGVDGCFGSVFVSGFPFSADVLAEPVTSSGVITPSPSISATPHKT